MAIKAEDNFSPSGYDPKGAGKRAIKRENLNPNLSDRQFNLKTAEGRAGASAAIKESRRPSGGAGTPGHMDTGHASNGYDCGGMGARRGK